jgi:TPP-dependent pyruvate/acetoin dehydrogenase alpha subunit
MKKIDLIAFEDKVAEVFNSGRIKAPVHLYSGNEDEIINVFAKIKHQDWVFCSWRSHYQCLLKGVPPEEVMSEIVAGRSISLCFPEHKIYSSAIVGGVLPIAVGTALSIKIKGGKEKVYCFIGDMTSETGIAHETIKYSRNNNLPIHFIIEDNGLSVVTDTREAWATKNLLFEGTNDDMVTYYTYRNKYPHAGAGTRVQF